MIPCVSSTPLRESNGCVIRLWTICVVSAHHRFRHVRLIALSADPKALSAHCLMKSTSSKADVFSNQRERRLQRRNFPVMKKPSPSVGPRFNQSPSRLISAVGHQRSRFSEALLGYYCRWEESRLFPTSIPESWRELFRQNLVWAPSSVASVTETLKK